MVLKVQIRFLSSLLACNFYEIIYCLLHLKINKAMVPNDFKTKNSTSTLAITL